MILNSLLQPTLVKMVSPGRSSKKTPQDLEEHVLIGQKNLEIVKRDIMRMTVRH